MKDSVIVHGSTLFRTFVFPPAIGSECSRGAAPYFPRNGIVYKRHASFLVPGVSVASNAF
jgi:hypothetical protein